MIPRATYRLQFHKDFTFADAARQVPYLATLGISHVYASPILTARAGSQHGYDVVDHAHINPELGGEAGLHVLSDALKAHDMGLIVDIVPNHMAVGQADNGWWLDVLAQGRGSKFASAFDVDWETLGDKILAPFLDGTPQALWDKSELKLVREQDRWAFAYYDHRFPLRPEDQALTGAPEDWATVCALLDRQHFILADWREADRRINWRRFFDITELAALRIAEPQAFEAVHARIFELYAKGLIDGIRVDHVDGLADPRAYCRALRARLEALRPGAYLIVEKIIAMEEHLPSDWGIDGTTGYDAMNELSAVLHADDGGVLERLWQQTSGRALSFEDEENLARQQILGTKFVAQFEATVRAFAALLPGLSPNALHQELTHAIVALRCYRGYGTGKPDSPAPGAILATALQQAPSVKPLFEDRTDNPAIIDALRRFHQLTAPIAAKAVEDTAFYRYGRLLSRNDVGFDPHCTALTADRLHGRIAERARDFPHAMLTTATHDHKRGEDVRARLAALSAHLPAWEAFLRHTPGPGAVDPADAYFLYQTLLGSWPQNPDEDFAIRITGWCRKQLREAKLRSSWTAPDTAYEEAFCALARRLILDDAGFRTQMTALLDAIRPQAQANSLVQVALRYTLPGVPDLYQGCEFGDLSLVDPDNRRPVDYAARAAALAAPLTPQSPFDHRKQKLIDRLLAARRRVPQLWDQGDYAPMAMPPGLIGFRRRHGMQSLLVIARCNGWMCDGSVNIPNAGRDIVAERELPAGSISLTALLDPWPVAVVLAETLD